MCSVLARLKHVSRFYNFTLRFEWSVLPIVTVSAPRALTIHAGNIDRDRNMLQLRSGLTSTAFTTIEGHQCMEWHMVASIQQEYRKAGLDTKRNSLIHLIIFKSVVDPKQLCLDNLNREEYQRWLCRIP